MYTLNLPAIDYFDGQTFQVKYPVYCDDELYTRIHATTGNTILQEWQDLNLTPAQAVQKVNTYLNGRYIGTHTEWYVYNPLNSTQNQWYITHQSNLFNQFSTNIKQIRPTTGNDTLTETWPTTIALLNGAELNATQRDNMGRTAAYNGTKINTVYAGGYNYIDTNLGADNKNIVFQLEIAPSDIFIDNTYNPAYENVQGHYLYIEFHFDCDADLVVTKVKKVVVRCIKYSPNVLKNAFYGIMSLYEF